MKDCQFDELQSLNDLGKVSTFIRENGERTFAAEGMAAEVGWAEARIDPTGQASDADKAIVTRARDHLEVSRALPMPVVDSGGNYHSRWKNWRDNLYECAKTFTDCQQVLHHAQLNVPFDHREKFDDARVDVLNVLMHDEFPDFVRNLLQFGDNPKSDPETVQEVDGVLSSNILFWHLRTLCFCRKYTNVTGSVAEIGGGYGALARLWLRENKVSRYVIIDLPESLFFAEVALRDEFGDKIGYWEGQDPGTQLVLLPITRLSECEINFDLVINTGSMQEMSDRWIDFYMNWLRQRGAKFFYSLNYMGQPCNYMYESRTLWAPRPPAEWMARLINVEPTLVKLMSLGREFCEVLYQRGRPRTDVFNRWSVFGGEILTRKSYIEGLELLREDFTVENATLFLDAQGLADPPFRVLKEIRYLIGFVKSHGVTKYDELDQRILSHVVSVCP